MSETGGQQVERLDFHTAVRLFQADPALWGRVRNTTGRVEVTELVNGVKFITEQTEGVRTFHILGAAPDRSDIDEVVGALRHGEAKKLLREKMN